MTSRSKIRNSASAQKNGNSDIARAVVKAAAQLRDTVDAMRFAAPVTHTYNPLRYAWEPHERYLRRFGGSRKKVVFLGMNPGPFGMAQTGVPFGEIRAVSDWLGISGAVGKPSPEHPNRPVTGFECPRSEISGQRLWGLFASRFEKAEKFFEEHLVMNYCPLAFLEEGGKNRTPDKLSPREKKALFEACDQHLQKVIVALQPEWVIGVGAFATNRAQESISVPGVKFGQILHPSPASPAANKNWAKVVTQQLEALKIW